VHHITVDLDIPPSEHDDEGVHDPSQIHLIRTGHRDGTVAGGKAGEVRWNVDRIQMHQAVPCEVRTKQQENSHMEHNGNEVECPLYKSVFIEKHQEHGQNNFERNVAPRKDEHHPVMITDETEQTLPRSAMQLALAEVTPKPRPREIRNDTQISELGKTREKIKRNEYSNIGTCATSDLHADWFRGMG